VRFRDDILRGLRLGAILLALFIAGVAGYRVVREAPAARNEKDALTPETPKPAPPVRAPDPRFLSGAPIPPPPPTAAGARKTARHAAPAAPAPPMEIADKPVDSPPASESIVREAPVETAAQPEPVPEKIAEPLPVTPVAKPEARPKRWARAVGRFLHIVHSPNN
jgi:hypothetical protein